MVVFSREVHTFMPSVLYEKAGQTISLYDRVLLPPYFDESSVECA